MVPNPRWGTSCSASPLVTAAAGRGVSVGSAPRGSLASVIHREIEAWPLASDSWALFTASAFLFRRFLRSWAVSPGGVVACGPWKLLVPAGNSTVFPGDVGRRGRPRPPRRPGACPLGPGGKSVLARADVPSPSTTALVGGLGAWPLGHAGRSALSLTWA